MILDDCNFWKLQLGNAHLYLKADIFFIILQCTSVDHDLVLSVSESISDEIGEKILRGRRCTV